MRRSLGFAALRLLVLMILASLAGATMIRFAPGFTSDEQELNPGLSSASVEAIRQARLADANIPHFYAHYLKSLLHGDLGTSTALNQPVRDLLRERLPVTLKNLGIALLLGWTLGLALAVAAYLSGSRIFSFAADGVGGSLISTPAAVMALIFLMLRWPPVIAAGVLILPKIYRYCQNLLEESSRMPHVFAARTRGAGRWRVLAMHMGPIALPQLLALAGVSVSIGLGVLLPIEVICDVAGIGQLAWTAALSRDLPLLVNLTLVVSFMTICSTMFSDAIRSAFGIARENA
jgi:peptide/nickel transport system permease protein